MTQMVSKISAKDLIAFLTFLGSMVSMWMKIERSDAVQNQRLSHIEQGVLDQDVLYKEVIQGLDDVQETLYYISGKLDAQEEAKKQATDGKVR